MNYATLAPPTGKRNGKWMVLAKRVGEAGRWGVIAECSNEHGARQIAAALNRFASPNAFREAAE